MVLLSAATRLAARNTLLTRNTASRMVHIEAKLEELNITLPPPPAPKANYNIVCRDGNTIYVSGHLPVTNDGTLLTGVVGPDSGGKTIEEAYEAARWTGLNIISTLKNEVGDLDKIEQIVKVFGIVNSTTDFKNQHNVVDGCSDLMMEVFGKPVGYHARSAIGTSTLPLDVSVEIEAIVKVKSD
mmetsp:Transcript_10867/g.16366  ORF Transcript_10867/g.16366 Transcript_10867/m.16366 type:complete len:184 (-) Transcript_10867:82-633(-)